MPKDAPSAWGSRPWRTARATFRDWAPSRPTIRARFIEAALAHVVAPNKVEAAYARSDLFERRRRLMDDYMESYMDGHADESTRR